jgi:tetratricopeptide (TPR) repeat protein
VVVFDLKSELAKGGTNYSFQELFKVQPYSFVTQKRIGVQWGDQNLKQVIDERGIEEGIKELQRMKDVKRTYEKYIFQEWVLKAVGQQYLEEKKYDFAIEVFKLNVQEYPASSTVYSDLAEAYLNINNTTLAIQNYRKAVELDLSDYVSIKKLRLLQQVDPGEIVNPLFTKTIKEGIQEGYEVFLEMKNSNTAPAELFINAVGYNLLM